ncbi:MAG: hypothetical protein XE06_0029 [Anaerolineaceae bacterium 46_22]|jgi:hypothetical protein|nr:MAG: hypothetical protein XE06_0029 [Anaerolineaceae bacterium 46_22]
MLDSSLFLYIEKLLEVLFDSTTSNDFQIYLS